MTTTNLLCFRNILLYFLFMGTFLSGSIIKLPDLVRTSDSIITLSYASNNLKYDEIGKSAFSMHGAFRLTTGNEYDYKVRITALEDQSIILQISDRNSIIHKSTFNNGDFYKSFLEALDKTIEYTGREQKLKGFFSGKFAFVGRRGSHPELYVSDLFFTKIKQVTFDKSFLTRPKWSPSGSELIYTTYHKSGFPDMYKLDPSTGYRSIVAAFKGTNVGGVYSPSGRKIAMALSVDGNTDLYTLSIATNRLKRISKTDALESSPSWSPDGKNIVFASDVLGQPQLYKINSNGGSIKRLKTNISSYCAEPDWNPRNDDLISFTASVNGCFQICLYSIKENKSIVLTDASEGAIEPIWMPDGRHLVYTERTINYDRLVLLDTITLARAYLHSTNFGSVSGSAYVLKSD